MCKYATNAVSLQVICDSITTKNNAEKNTMYSAFLVFAVLFCFYPKLTQNFLNKMEGESNDKSNVNRM